jgi:membrane protease YdiL (CAAX protease family)
MTTSNGDPDPFEIAQLSALGPALAALFLTLKEKGKEGLKAYSRQITKWRIGLPWFGAIIFLPLIWSGILPSIILYLILNKNLPAFLGPSYGAPPWNHAWWFFLYIIVIGGGQEELGWRGYLLPRLQEKYNAVVSSLIVGVIWSCWHLPFFYIPNSAFYGTPFIGYMIQLTSLSFIFTWLYNNSGSILACILYHAWMNFVGAYLMVDITEPIYGLVILFIQFAIPVAIVVLYGSKSFSGN